MFSRARPSHGAAGVAGKQAQGSKKGNNFYTENYKTLLKELNKSMSCSFELVLSHSFSYMSVKKSYKSFDVENLLFRLHKMLSDIEHENKSTSFSMTSIEIVGVNFC